jgi:heptosyltransferase-1
VADVALTLQPHIHAVARSRELCAKSLHYSLPLEMKFGLLGLAAHAQEAIQNIALNTGPSGVVALVHGTSRADKQWPLAHWRALGQRLNDSGYMVALPQGSDAEEQVAIEIAKNLSHAQVWPRLALDALTDAMATCAGVIGVDSGLSHIAVALDLPHVQIYNFDTAWRTGPAQPASAHPLRQCSVFGHPSPTLEAVWQAWLGVSGISHTASAR